jgi:hypothetical protein
MCSAREWGLIVIFVLSAAAAPAALSREIQAGPIWNDFDAKGKCPNVCQRNGNARWNGQWHTIPGTATSVCDCVGGAAPPPASSSREHWEPAGPLFNQIDAQNKCPRVCDASGGRAWDGNWKTTEPGRMSVCACTGRGAARAGVGSSCSAPAHGQCAGCSAQCGAGQRAACSAGTTSNDRFRNGDTSCMSAAQCGCQ